MIGRRPAGTERGHISSWPPVRRNRKPGQFGSHRTEEKPERIKLSLRQTSAFSAISCDSALITAISVFIRNLAQSGSYRRSLRTRRSGAEERIRVGGFVGQFRSSRRARHSRGGFMEQLDLRDVQRVDQHKGSIVVIDRDPPRKPRDGAVIRRRYLVARTVRQNDNERLKRTSGETLQQLGDDDGG